MIRGKCTGWAGRKGGSRQADAVAARRGRNHAAPAGSEQAVRRRHQQTRRQGVGKGDTGQSDNGVGIRNRKGYLYGHVRRNRYEGERLSGDRRFRNSEGIRRGVPVTAILADRARGVGLYALGNGEGGPP